MADVKNYIFEDFNRGKNNNLSIENYKMNDLKEKQPKRIDSKPKQIRQERQLAQKRNFKISEHIEKYRGHDDQHHMDIEKMIKEEAARRVDQVKQKAYEEGFAKGHQEALDQTLEESKQKQQQIIQTLEEFCTEIFTYKENLISTQREDLMKMLKSLTKWVVLKEVDSSEYMESLLEKLLLELHSKTDLTIWVSQEKIDSLGEVIEAVQAKVGQLTNVRMEVSREIEGTGIIVESQNGIVDGTMTAQFQSIDSAFETIGIKDEPGDL